MSRLFDALQRSQQDVSPKTPPSTSAVELLGRTEHVAPRLEAIPSFRLSLNGDSRLDALTQPYGLAAEQFRMLGVRLQHLSETRPLKTVLVTSASFQEGKSLVSLNLAITLAKHAHKKVLLIEGDMRKPSLGKTLGLPHLMGLKEWIDGNRPLAGFLCRLADLDLWLLTAGGSCDEPLKLMQSPRMRKLLSEATERFDWVFIDSAPLMVADAAILSRLADGTLVVVRNDQTSKKTLQNSLGSVEKPLGFVLNDYRNSYPRGYKHYYRYLPTVDSGRSKHEPGKNVGKTQPGSVGTDDGMNE